MTTNSAVSECGVPRDQTTINQDKQVKTINMCPKTGRSLATTHSNNNQLTTTTAAAVV